MQVQQANASNLARIKALLGELDQAHQTHDKELLAAEARMATMRQDFHGRIEEARNAEAAARRDVAELQASVSLQLSDAERMIQQADARSNAVRSLLCSAVMSYPRTSKYSRLRYFFRTRATFDGSVYTKNVTQMFECSVLRFSALL
jgi:regulator of protease activity HflC (stomatin/prohibitin superfamily)